MINSPAYIGFEQSVRELHVSLLARRCVAVTFNATPSISAIAAISSAAGAAERYVSEMEFP